MIPIPPIQVPYKKPPINDKTEAAGKLQTIKKQYVNMKIKNEIKKLLDI